MLESKTTFSIIIPTINEEAIIADCLSAISNNGPEVEIISAISLIDPRLV
jgi:glycosyltransferase involved in cell wall biosynthesis